MATLHRSAGSAFRQRISGYLILALVFLCHGWLLAGCGDSPPAVLSVSDAVRLRTTQPQRIAGVLLWGDDQRLSLATAIALIPGAPATVDTHVITVIAGSATPPHALPWRDTGTVRYLPVIVTVHTDPVGQHATLTNITFGIGEYHLSHLPDDNLVRITGRFVRRDGQQLLVDPESPTQFITLQPTALTELLPSHSDLLIEGVAVQSVFLPLVIAPITTHP